jgi:outer membrane protein
MKNIHLGILILALLSSCQVFAQRSLTLEESKKLALENNAAIKNSTQEIMAAEETKKSAFTRYFPNVSAGGLMWNAQKHLMEMETEGGNLPVYDGDPANIGSATQFAYLPGSTMGFLQEGTIGYVNVVQPIFTGGRIVTGNKLAALGVEVSEFQKKLRCDEVLLKTEELYWQIVALSEKQKTITSYETLLNRVLAQVEDAYHSGMVMKNDVLKVKLKLSEVLLNKSKLDNGKSLATMAFCQHIGIKYDRELVLEEKLNTTDTPQRYFIDRHQALLTRTEYALLEKSVEAEKLLTRVKRGEHLPEAGIGASWLHMKLDDSESRNFGMVFGQVSVPISGWWGGSHEMQVRKARERIAENNFENQSELMALQIQKAWQDLTDANHQVQLSEESKIQSEENLKVNNDSYRNGLITMSDLLEAMALSQQAQDQLIDARAQYMVKKRSYLQVTGQ